MKELLNLPIFQSIKKYTIVGISIRLKKYERKYSYKLYIIQLIPLLVIIPFINSFFTNYISTSFYILLYLILVPISYFYNVKRQFNEKIFEQVILYCNYMTINLKEHKMVYKALSNTSMYLDGEITNDVNKIINSLQEVQDIKHILNEFESKYNYSVVKVLNIIIYQMYYQNASNSDIYLSLLSEEIENLIIDIEYNQKKRKSLRLQYFSLAIFTLIFQYFTKHFMGVTYLQIMSHPKYYMYMNIFLFSIIISMFLIDIYFNQNITKE